MNSCLHYLRLLHLGSTLCSVLFQTLSTLSLLWSASNCKRWCRQFHMLPYQRNWLRYCFNTVDWIIFCSQTKKVYKDSGNAFRIWLNVAKQQSRFRKSQHKLIFGVIGKLLLWFWLYSNTPEAQAGVIFIQPWNALDRLVGWCSKSSSTCGGWWRKVKTKILNCKTSLWV